MTPTSLLPVVNAVRTVVGLAAIAVAAWWSLDVGLRGASRQLWAGAQADWADLETWSRPADRANELEVGLGLQVTGPSGTVALAFVGRLRPASQAAPGDIEVRAALGPRTNPNAIRKPSLTFLVDRTSSRPVALDLGRRLAVDGAPGGVVRQGISSITASDFLQMATAETLSGNVLGLDVMFRRDQIDALRKLADSLRLAPPASRLPAAR
jgi:hypothetical protein